MGKERLVHFTDDEYTALMTEAEQTGQDVESLIKKAIDEHIDKVNQLKSKISRPRSNLNAAEVLYYAGIAENLPTEETLSEEEEAELERLADLFGYGEGNSAAEMVIEDRGPY
jgi:hypothetical protein